MKTLEKRKITRLNTPTVNGDCWDGQIWRSFDGGKTWIETGYNKLFKNVVEATAWKYEV